MRALGPGSISSFLKIILDVVFAALWIGVAVLSLLTLATLLLSYNPDILAGLRESNPSVFNELARNGPAFASGGFFFLPKLV